MRARGPRSKMAAALLYACAAFVVWDWSYSARAETCDSLGYFVDCSRKGLVSLPKDLELWTKRLDLQSNAILMLREEDFKGLENLTELDLSSNEIRYVNESIFLHTPRLETLKMNYNKLTAIPMFGVNNSLRHLSLSHNQIETLDPVALSRLWRLQTLDLNYNKIMDIPMGTFPANAQLQILLLNNNRIFTLEKGCLDNLTSLQHLKLNKNKLQELPKKAFNLTNLRVLELMRNKLHRVDGLTFDGLENLQLLKLKRNAITTLMDGAFWGLKSIKNLQLDHNNISVVKKGWLYGLEKLRQLSLASNEIQQIEPESWHYCDGLNKLFLDHNRISTIGAKSFSELSNLKDLFLSHNRVSRIDGGAFTDLGSLHTLEMNNNEISWTIEDMSGAFAGLNALNKLGLRTNRIKMIAVTSFAGLEGLQTLLLDDNAIASIQENAFDELRQLDDLRFNSSSLLCDCKLAWLPRWLQDRGFHHSVTAVCSHPEQLKGRSIFDISFEEFTCNDEEFPKPIITEHPKSQIALKGDNLTLSCSATITGPSTPKFQWKKDNEILTAERVETVANSNGKLKLYTTHLYLYNVQDKAAGEYQCIISNSFGPAYSKRARINVHVFPTFMKRPVDVTVKAGKTAKLECSAAGQPAPIIAWMKDGGDDFPAARERRMHIMPSDDTFFIVQTTSKDEGVYSCKAENDAGVIIANATVTVLETPSFTMPMVEEKTVKEGDTAVLECMASGSPKPRLEWLKEEKSLEETPRHFLTANDQLLIIVQTQKSDAGKYTCKMTNTLGTQKDDTTLKVVDGDAPGGSKPNRPEGLDDASTTTGIIIIAVVCCVVGTSLVWVIIIYQTRKRHELYSATPTDETTLPGEVPSSGYSPSDREGSYTQPLNSLQSYPYPDYAMKESGYESVNGNFQPAGWTRQAPAIFPSDVDEDDMQQTQPLTKAGSASSLHYPHSETDTLGSSHSTSSTHTSGGHPHTHTHPHLLPQTQPHPTLHTFHPQRTDHDRCSQTPSPSPPSPLPHPPSPLHPPPIARPPSPMPHSPAVLENGEAGPCLQCGRCGVAPLGGRSVSSGSLHSWHSGQGPGDRRPPPPHPHPRGRATRSHTEHSEHPACECASRQRSSVPSHPVTPASRPDCRVSMTEEPVCNGVGPASSPPSYGSVVNCPGKKDFPSQDSNPKPAIPSSNRPLHHTHSAERRKHEKMGGV